MVDLESIAGPLQVLPDRSRRIVAPTPGPIVAQIVGQLLDEGVEHDHVAPRAHHRPVCLEFLKDVLGGVVGIEDHHDRSKVTDGFGYLGLRLRIDR